MTLWKECQELTDNGMAFVMATITKIRGSAPQDEGAKILVTKEGRFAGTVGGGRIEMSTIKKCQDILESPEALPPETVVWNLQTEIGMSCGGETTLLFEHFTSNNWPIVVFGAGHVSQAIIAILKTLKCQVTCLDTRKEWLTKLTGIKTIHTENLVSEIKHLDPKSYFIVVTMGHDHDLPILVEISRLFPQTPYVGCIGSDVKGLRMKKQLHDQNVSEEFIQKLRIPMGLTLGTNLPPEIAISVTAELLQVRDQRLNQG